MDVLIKSISMIDLQVCVVTVRGLAGSWYSRRWKIFMELLGCLACLYSLVGEPHML